MRISLHHGAWFVKYIIAIMVMSTAFPARGAARQWCTADAGPRLICGEKQTGIPDQQCTVSRCTASGKWPTVLDRPDKPDDDGSVSHLADLAENLVGMLAEQR